MNKIKIKYQINNFYLSENLDLSEKSYILVLL